MVAKTGITGLMMALMALSAPVVWADTAAPDVKPAAAVTTTTDQKGDWHQAKEARMMAEVLNLTEDQQNQLKDIKQKQRDARKSAFEQLKANKTAFESEIVKATPDMTKITDLQTQLKTLQSQMVDDHLNSILEIKKLMTPEQFAGYMALEKEEDLMKMEHHQFGHRDGFGKDGEGFKHWGDKDEAGHDHDSQQ